jgi:hypothetical protein
MSQYSPVFSELDEKSRKLHFLDNSSVSGSLSQEDVQALWRSDATFCAVFTQALTAAPFDAVFWETPPRLPGDSERPFECMLLDAPSLARMRPDQTSFAGQFGGDGPDVATFMNLGGDAELVAPRQKDAEVDYTHLTGFLRTAPAEHVREFWRATGEVADRWSRRGRPFWISTSGLGVGWLHVRIDTRPKYYTHAPYRTLA